MTLGRVTPQTWLDQTFLLIHTSSNNDLAWTKLLSGSFRMQHQTSRNLGEVCPLRVDNRRWTHVPAVWFLQWPKHQLLLLLAVVHEHGGRCLRPLATDQLL